MKESFNKIIEKKYKSMSKSHKRVADYISKNYEKAAFMTAASLGETVGISESTVVRFASSIGFKGYPEFQKYLQELIKNQLTSIQRMEAANKYQGEQFIDNCFMCDIEMIKQTKDNLSNEAFEGSVKAINNARKIYILGVRSSAALADFTSFYMSFLYDVVLIDTSSTSEMFEQMMKINDKDVCIAISFPRYSNQTIKALDFAKSRNATIISITDGNLSPIADFATFLLVAKSSMVSFVDSLVAPLSLINALVAACAREREDEIHNNLVELEKIWNQYNVYKTEKSGAIG